jgi:hypothetical protein
MPKNREAGKGHYPRQEYTKEDKERYDKIFDKRKRRDEDDLPKDAKRVLPKHR